MPAFSEANVENGFAIVKGFAEANGAGQDRSNRPYSKGKIAVNTDLIINSLIHSPSVDLTREDAEEVKRRIAEWKASLPAA